MTKKRLLPNIEEALNQAKPTQEIYDRLADKLQDDFNKMSQESREKIKADELARKLKFSKNWTEAYDKIASRQGKRAKENAEREAQAERGQIHSRRERAQRESRNTRSRKGEVRDAQNDLDI